MSIRRVLRFAMPCLLLLAVTHGQQSTVVERTFSQSKLEIEKALKTLQPNLSGRLPVLDGFAETGQHPMERYQRGFYQSTIQVVDLPSGTSKVRVTAKVTAWYSDPQNTHSGYELLKSNGRIENDLLDQLSEALKSSATITPTPAAEGATSMGHNNHQVSGPPAEISGTNVNPASPFRKALSSVEGSRRTALESPVHEPDAKLKAEVDSLEEILKNQGHPKNLVAVKKSGTPVVGTPSLSAKPLFLASLHDEFEMLDFNADWVHVRVSGLSRGWIWRNSVEMPEGIPDTAVKNATAPRSAADIFHISREETAQFPGDWEPLRGKNVRIVSVQKNDEQASDADSKGRLEFVKFVFDKEYPDASKKQDLLGLVVIFDSADGGLIAATMQTIQQWKAGNLSDSALWHKCFFDPPEALDSSTAGASQ